MSEVSPAGRSDAVQLLRQATDARLKKPSGPERSKLRRSRSFNAYPGFIPDPEVLERQELLRKQSSNSLRDSQEAKKKPPVKAPLPSRPHLAPNAHKPRAQVTFRKSGLPTKKTLAQRRSRAIHAKPSNRISKSYGASRKVVIPQRQPAPILRTDPLGFLANRFDKSGDQSSDLSSILTNPNPKKPFDIDRRQQLRRSRSFNAIQEKGHLRPPRPPLSPSSIPYANNAQGSALYRSKSQRQVPKGSNKDKLDLLGVPFENLVSSPSQVSPSLGLRRWLSVGRKVCAMPDTPDDPPSGPILDDHYQNAKPLSKDETKPLPPPPKSTSKPSLGPNLGRMKSLKWIGKKKSTNKQSDKNIMGLIISEEPDDYSTPELTRSKTTKDRLPTKPPKLNRSNTGRIGNGEIIRSLKNFFDGLSLKSRGNQSPDDHIVRSPDMEDAKKPVVQIPELSLKKIVIQDSCSNQLPEIPEGRLFTGNSLEPRDNGSTTNENVITPNIADTSFDYFAIPIKSARRPSKDTESNSGAANITILDEISFSYNNNNYNNSQIPGKGPAFHVDYSESPFPMYPQVSEGIEFARAEFHEISNHASPNIMNKSLPALPLASDEPLYKLVYNGPVKQIIDSTTIKDRHLFLFDHILVVTKLALGSSSQGQPQYIITKVIWVDAINEVTQNNGSHEDSPTEGPNIPSLPRKYIPVLMATIRRFEIEPSSAISYLVGRGAVKPEPSAIARLLHNTPELDRRMIGRFLIVDKSFDVLEAFLSRFHWYGFSLDLALRSLFSALRLPNKESEMMLILNRVAYYWHSANRNVFPLSSIVSLILYILKLSKIKPGDVPSLQQFLDSCPDSDASTQDKLKIMYDSVLKSPLVECSDHPKLPIGVGGRPSSRFIQNEKSESIWVKIPAPDSNFQLILQGAGISCDPPILDFSASDTQWFTVTGSVVGRLSLMLVPFGSSAGNYEFLTTKTFVVEPTFMKHTFAVSFPTTDVSASSHEDIILASPALTKHTSQCRKRYLFGMNDASELLQWTDHLENTIDLYQEALDEWAAQLDEENQIDNSTWIAEAEETSQLRHQALASSAVQLFQPLLGRPLTRSELISLAGRYPDGVPPPNTSNS